LIFFSRVLASVRVLTFRKKTACQSFARLVQWLRALRLTLASSVILGIASVVLVDGRRIENVNVIDGRFGAGEEDRTPDVQLGKLTFCH
jgi:hypothetical protein